MGAKIAVSSAIPSSRPPRKWRIAAGAPSRRLRCRWHELPGQSERGLAMNVASSPWRAAISFTALLSRNASSAARSAGAARTVDLELARTRLGRARLHREPVLPQRRAHRAGEVLVPRGRDHAVDARALLDRLQLRRALRQHRLRRLAQRVELELDPDDRLDAHGRGALDHGAQDGARRQRDGAAVAIDEVAQQQRRAVVPRDDAGRLEVGHREHVRIAVAREPAVVPRRRLDGLDLVDRQRPDDVATARCRARPHDPAPRSARACRA